MWRVLLAHRTPTLLFSRGVIKFPSNIYDAVFLRNQFTTLSHSFFMQQHSILDVWRGSEYTSVQIVTGNVFHHHNKYLIRYLKFLPGSKIISLLLNILEKFHWEHLFEKLEETETHPFHLFLIQCNTHTLWRATSTIQTNGDHHHFLIKTPNLYLAKFLSILLTKLVFWL